MRQQLPFLFIGYFVSVIGIYFGKGSYNKRGWSLRNRDWRTIPVSIYYLEMFFGIGVIGLIYMVFGATPEARYEGVCCFLVATIIFVSILLHATLIEDSVKTFSEDAIKNQFGMHVFVFIGSMECLTVGGAIYFYFSLGQFEDALQLLACSVLILVCGVMLFKVGRPK